MFFAALSYLSQALILFNFISMEVVLFADEFSLQHH